MGTIVGILLFLGLCLLVVKINIDNNRRRKKMTQEERAEEDAYDEYNAQIW